MMLGNAEERMTTPCQLTPDKAGSISMISQITFFWYKVPKCPTLGEQCIQNFRVAWFLM